MASDSYSKVESSSSGSNFKVSGGASNSGSSGPTGSTRTYPKGKGSAHNTNWNPQKMKASTYGICGV
jgi:hypothetical protein